MNIFKFFKKKPAPAVEEQLPVKLNVKRCHLLIETNSGDNYVKEIIGDDLGPNPFCKETQHMVYPPTDKVHHILKANGIRVSSAHDSSVIWIPFSSIKQVTITSEEDFYVDVE